MEKRNSLIKYHIYLLNMGHNPKPKLNIIQHVKEYTENVFMIVEEVKNSQDSKVQMVEVY
jgi:hypothetical protein